MQIKKNKEQMKITKYQKKLEGEGEEVHAKPHPAEILAFFENCLPGEKTRKDPDEHPHH